jgi:hypothetical protein
MALSFDHLDVSSGPCVDPFTVVNLCPAQVLDTPFSKKRRGGGTKRAPTGLLDVRGSTDGRRVGLTGEDSEVAFFKRLARAKRCPISGPCAFCETTDLHYCELGERQRGGLTPGIALEDALAALQWTHPEGRFRRRAVVDQLLARSCQFHRKEAETLLARSDSTESDTPEPEAAEGVA